MTIHVFGDLHGDRLHMMKIIRTTLPGDTLISVGDYGLDKETTEWLEKHYVVKILVCHGNKENWKNPPEFVPPGGIVEVEGVRFGFAPGAASPNGFLHPERKKHEMPEWIVWDGPVDVVVTHDRVDGSALEASDSSFLTKGDRERCEESRRRVTSAVEKSGAKLHVHGHYHVKFQEQIGNRTHICLPAAPTLETLKINGG